METATLSSQEWTTEKQHLAETLQIVVNERQKLENDLGIVDGNDPYMYGEKVKAQLIFGARKLRGEAEYPNPRVGWGALCIEQSIPL